ncbi:hypothetical protein HY624_04030 [Candidatus Uhrbacteria bacterium]|nr:hypothetical protein [Candidatus Uhrbacteria bacterium]
MTMNQATCSACGKSCEVPFKPTGDRPVYCRDCFGQQGGRDGGRPSRFDGAREERPRFSDKQMHDAVCVSCGSDCQVPFRPVAGKPVYCKNCFDKGGSGKKDSQDSGAVAQQLAMVNAKLDKLMTLLTSHTSEKKSDAPAVQEEVAVEAVVMAKKKRKAKKKSA